MELNFRFSLSFSSIFMSSLLLCFLLPGFSTANHISDDVLDSHGSTGRSLLQTRRGCPVNFEFLNYTVLTDRCRGPRYLPDPCCSAFRTLACPFSKELNDPKTECATIMFNYINLNGNYPPGLFASECRDGKDGLDCTNFTSPNTAADSNSAGPVDFSFSPLSQMLSLIPGSIIILFFL